MSKRITVIVASHSGARLKQVTLSRISLALTAFAIFAAVCFAGYIFSRYHTLERRVSRTRQLSRAITNQKNALGEQQQQIKDLAGRINAMQSALLELHEFDRKIRVIANIESKPETPALIGIGGVSPEDIDTQIGMEERQNDLVRGMHHQLSLLESACNSQADGFSALLRCLEDKRQLLASTPAIRPVNGGWVTSRFEYRISPFTGQKEFHPGLDISASTDTPVMASADGEVVFSGFQEGGLGKMIIIDHGRGLITRYGHLTQCLKKPGEFVKREDIVGTVGNSGQSTGPHLHYEVRINGMPVNPEAYILN